MFRLLDSMITSNCDLDAEDKEGSKLQQQAAVFRKLTTKVVTRLQTGFQDPSIYAGGTTQYLTLCRNMDWVLTTWRIHRKIFNIRWSDRMRNTQMLRRANVRGICVLYAAAISMLWTYAADGQSSKWRSVNLGDNYLDTKMCKMVTWRSAWEIVRTMEAASCESNRMENAGQNQNLKLWGRTTLQVRCKAW